MSAETAGDTTIWTPVGAVGELPLDTLRMVRAGGRRVLLVRTETGVHALDNACPHQGYGLVQGELSGDTVTCQWHNWKFRVTDGQCVLGEEDVAAHAVRIEDGQVLVGIHEP